MSSALSVAVAVVGHVPCYILRGSLNEFCVAPLRELAASLKSPSAFDLAGIDSINSCGLAEWMMFIQRYGKGKDIELRSCSPVVVNCLNLSGGFAAGTRVASLMVPLRCVQNHPQLLSVSVEQAEGLAQRPQICNICRSVTKPDVDLGDYLGFLAGST